MIQFVNLNWDSDFFGFKVARLTDFDPAELHVVLDYLARHEYRLAVLYSGQNDQQIHRAAKDNNGMMVDRKVTYARKVPPVLVNDTGKPGVNGHLRINPSGLEPEELYELAYLAGGYSRFRIDTNFPGETFKKLYAQWVINSLHGDFADYTLVYYADQGIGGFSTLKIEAGIAKIGLISVDTTRQNQGIGRSLMQETFNICSRHGIAEVEVVTQMDNIQACRFYEKSGFAVKDVNHIFHFWLG